MAETRIKIDLEQGILEAEGSESFVRSIYDDFKEHLNKVNRTGSNKPPKSKKVKKDTNGGTSSRKRAKGASKKKSPTFLKQLKLSGGKELQSLKDFYSTYKVKSNHERNLVFAYYLEHKMESSNITSDHIFTCYRTLGEKVPALFDQSLWDTSSRKHWLDTSSLNNIKVTPHGINFIEHDLPKAEAKS